MDLITLPTNPIAVSSFSADGWGPSAAESHALFSPYTNTQFGSVCYTEDREVQTIVAKAHEAWPAWRATPIKERSALLSAFRGQLLSNQEDLSNLIAMESGKTKAEALAGLLKGIEVIDFALSLQNVSRDNRLQVSRGVWCMSEQEPLGVVAGITPFNFPAMVPLWLFPIAITLGNCFILKPSEKVPATSTRMAALMDAVGFPRGVFSVVHGDKRCVEALIDNPTVKAVGFVGSSLVAESVYKRATLGGKRALCLGGAKNQLIVAPDADPEITLRGILDSFTGCAGQRCMAGSVAILIDSASRFIDPLCELAAQRIPGPQLGAIIDAAARARLGAALDKAVEQGARLLLDGRLAKPPAGYERGNWLGPSILDNATPTMECATKELFGPILTILRVKTLSEALELERNNPYGNATAIFTASASIAQQVATSATAGMIGVNIGVPVPREPFSFGGTKGSRFGHGDITGYGAVEFWTTTKKVTTKWQNQSDQNWMS